MYLNKHQPHWLHTLIEHGKLLHSHINHLIHPILHVLVITIIIVIIIPALSHLLFLHINVTCKLYQCCGCFVEYFISLSLRYIELSDNTLCNQVENVHKTAGLTILSLELIDEPFKLAYHFVFIASIVASNT